MYNPNWCSVTKKNWLQKKQPLQLREKKSTVDQILIFAALKHPHHLVWMIIRYTFLKIKPTKKHISMVLQKFKNNIIAIKTALVLKAAVVITIWKQKRIQRHSWALMLKQRTPLMLPWLWRTHNMLRMFHIPLQLCGIRPTKLDTWTHAHTHTQRYTHATALQLRVSLIMFLPWVPLSSLKRRQEKGVQTGAGWQRKAAETESSSLSG